MSYYFNGTLYETPTTVSAINDDAMVSTGLTVGNVPCLIGTSTGGQPNTALTFGSADQAKATLRSGELLSAVLRCFDPSDETGGPSSVVVVRVNPAVQAALVLADSGSKPVINVTSRDYGAYTNGIKVAISAGSTQGLKANVALGSSTYTVDNLYAAPFDIQYTGNAATATMTVTGDTVSLFAPIGTPAATIDLNQFSTYAALVDYINTVSGFTAVLSNGFDDKPTLNGLDFVSAVDVKSALYYATANLQAVVDWMNGSAQTLVSATRVAGAGTVPAALPYTFLAGGSDGLTTTSSFDDALTTLQKSDVQWITPVSSNPTIHAMVDAHVQFMSTTGRKERRAICGTPLGTSDAAALVLAKQLNSSRTSLVHLGHYAYDLTGAQSGLVLWAPYHSAAALIGSFAAVSIGEPLTNKAMKFAGLERDLLVPTDTDVLLKGGVLPLENAATGYKVVQSITTWLVDSKYDKREQSVGFACDYIARTVRDALDVLRGQKNNQITLARAYSITESALRKLAVVEPQGPGALAGDAKNPPYQGITVSASEDSIAVQFQCSPVLPANYIGITIYAVPFSGTASA